MVKTIEEVVVVEWSTRELAELAGTTLRAVRHYHATGLLEQPERRANGYKTYTVEHLLRVLWIRRLVDLGFSLSDIAGMASGHPPPAAEMRRRDAELQATIAKLQQARAQIADYLVDPTGAPPSASPSSSLSGVPLTVADREFLVVMAQVLDAETYAEYVSMIRSTADDPTLRELDEMTAEADETSRAELARRLVPHLRHVREEHARLDPLIERSSLGPELARQVIVAVTEHLYNRAQLDTVGRAHRLLDAPWGGCTRGCVLADLGVRVRR